MLIFTRKNGVEIRVNGQAVAQVADKKITTEYVVKTVEAETSATYVFGIGGLSKESIYNNAVAELTKKANLTGSQALVNVTVKNSAQFYLVYGKVTYHAEGTVVEFDE